MNYIKFRLYVIALILVVMISGCVIFPQQPEHLLPDYTVMHDDGYEVTVKHVAANADDISGYCNYGNIDSQGFPAHIEKRVKVKVPTGWITMGHKRGFKAVACMIPPTKERPIAYIYAPTLTDHDAIRGIWFHEVGVLPDGSHVDDTWNPDRGHAIGRGHPQRIDYVGIHPDQIDYGIKEIQYVPKGQSVTIPCGRCGK